ncbi:irregular chiasm C-roughest protein-like [Anopheles moucheti]|uniref:irregular chiasm C-roughest protein-like n=1 Tax=Anopheles moucheti TaxID=186751 RepID=UPI0022F0BDCE|nr:irregular chiasm C-roughest protein-like [Anopheles moucheti]
MFRSLVGRRKTIVHTGRSRLVAVVSPYPIFYLFLLLRAGSGAKLSPVANNRQIEQRFAMEPQDQTAIVGSRVTLPCRVVNKSGQLQWTKDDFGLGTHRNLSGFERYTMVGSDEEGDFSLDISPVMLDDDARYQCQVGPGRGGTPGIRSRFAKLTVLVPPEAPKIVQGDFMVTTEDREIELECVSVGGKPAAEITWIDGLGNVLTKGIEYMKEPLRDARRYTAKSILKLTPKKEHHNTTFTCQAQNTADRTYRSVRLKLEVKYAPKVKIAVIGGALNGGRILEGTEVRLSCRADANPPDVTFRWYVGEELSEANHASELLIANISRRYHGTTVRCEVRNAVGKSEESVTLDISYGPSFRALPQSLEADQDATVTLSCDIDGNPSPDVLWIHEPSDQVVSSANNVTLVVTTATAGRYYCKASVQGFAEIEAEATVYLRGPPAINSPRQQYGAVHDSAQLECVALSIPKPRHVLWSFNGREINISSEPSAAEYRALDIPIPNGVRSTLIIHHCQREHFGRYNCTVVNDYGIDFLEIDFVSKEQNLLPVIVLGSLGGITFLIIVIVIVICLCSRRNKKKHLPPADVIPKYDVPGKECGEHGGTTVSTEHKIDRIDDMLDGDHPRDTITTNIVLNVRSAAVPQTGTAAISSSLTALKGDTTTDYSRYSGDFSDSLSHLQCQKASGPGGGVGSSNNNGYVPYVNYARDYSPPTQHLMQFKASSSSNSIGNTLTGKPPAKPPNGQLPTGTMTLSRKRTPAPDLTRPAETGLPSIQSSVSSIPNGLMNHPMLGCHIGLDTRFGANYGTLHGRGSSSPMQLPPPATANPAATPAPPPYSATRNQNCLLGLGLTPAPGGTSSSLASSGNNSALLATGSSSPSSTQSGSLSLASSQLSQAASISGTGTVSAPGQPQGQQPQQQQQPNSPPGQFILPSSNTIKPGVLATHV